MEHRFQSSLHDSEPMPPSLSTQPLFRNDEILLFEDFLDNLATENEFLFHPKVPASLSWDGFSTTRNQAFDEVKHSGLQFGSDPHFSPTNGYVATHRFVPPGYGHVHPQSSAQRSQRSSASSRTHSRRESMLGEPHISDQTRREILNIVNSPTQPHGSGLPILMRPSAPNDQNYSTFSIPGTPSGSQYRFPDNQSIASRTVNDMHKAEVQNAGADRSLGASHPTSYSSRTAADRGSLSEAPNYPSFPHAQLSYGHSSSASISSTTRHDHPDDTNETAGKKIKIEDGTGKQTLTAGTKLQLPFKMLY